MSTELTEEEWKDICKDCYTEELWRVKGQYANTPEYLRRFIIYNAMQEFNEQIKQLKEKMEYWKERAERKQTFK